MPLPKLTKPIVFFDLETTGLIVELDRIVEIALLKIFPNGETFQLCQRFNPEMKIPAESSAVHGILNEHVAGEPRFAEMASKLFEIFSDSDLGGYNVQRLDIPLLIKEFARAGCVFSVEGRRVLDACSIFREKERRDLTAAYKFYCGKDLVGAHGAEADNRAAYEVFLAQLDRYPDLPGDLDGLHDFCRKSDPPNTNCEGRIVWRDNEAFLNFGKYRYRSLAEIAKSDLGYLDWIINKGEFPKELIEICRQAKKGIFPRRGNGSEPAGAA
ncbi:MAG: 3'-5' exonuclease [Elusimicrobia bacterium]|nr:3'-5' exonuclease [Elusimicrobiota bacterium]